MKQYDNIYIKQIYISSTIFFSRFHAIVLLVLQV